MAICRGSKKDGTLCESSLVFENGFCHLHQHQAPGGPLPWTRERLEAIVKAHNGPSRLYLTGADLSGVSLIGMDLSEVAFSYRGVASEDSTSNLQGAKLWDAKLERADLWWVNLREADLRRANLRQAQLRSANLCRALLGKADMEMADLACAKLRQVELQEAILRGASLDRADLHQANLQGADLQGAHLLDANLRQADLQEADLREARLKGAKLQAANLCDADLQKANLEAAQLQGARLDRARLQGAELPNASLQGASLPNANLQGAGLANANLHQANLRGANLQGADLRYANLQGADLADANLQGADLRRTNLQGADLRYANLKEVDLLDIRTGGLAGVKFYHVRLEHTLLRREQLGPAIRDEQMRTYRQARDAYLALKHNFESLGDYGAASWAYVKERQMEKLCSWPRRARRVYGREQLGDSRECRLAYYDPKVLWFYAKHMLKWLNDWCVELLCNYGESTWRVLGWMSILLLVAGPLLFGLFKLLRWPEESLRVYSSLPAPWRQAYAYLQHLLYVLDAFTTASFAELQPANHVARLLSGLLAIVGVFLTGLLAFVAGSRIRRS